MEEKNIIVTLVEQHNGLRKHVRDILDLSSAEQTFDTLKIDGEVKQFAKDLVEHLKLENEVFYVELLRRMEAKKQDTTKTRQFIDEMKGIEKVIYAFLGEFKDENAIKSAPIDFKINFIKVGEVLTLRMDVEEAGVYSYWGLF